jgi:RNA polymerase I-specific transcription initiation factor RRN7
MSFSTIYILIICRMIMHQDVPYARVLATVPREMRDRLPPELTGILEVTVS